MKTFKDNQAEGSQTFVRECTPLSFMLSAVEHTDLPPREAHDGQSSA